MDACMDDVLQHGGKASRARGSALAGRISIDLDVIEPIRIAWRPIGTVFDLGERF